MSSDSNTLSKYFFDETNSDVSRLKAQYSYLKSVFGYPQHVPPEIDIARLSRVIDVATGTGAWALDFASLPDVRDRNIQVFACDISAAKFPRADEQEANKITFFQQDITKPFPDDLLGTFDLVNLVLLSYALTEQGWKRALKNVHSLLKPGGHLFLRDSDLVIYNHERPPPPEGQTLNVSEYMQGTSVLANANRIFAGGALQKGFVVGLSYHFAKMFEEASLRVVSFQRISIPYGNYCDVQKGLNGTSLSDYKPDTVDNVTRLLDMSSLSVMKGGGLELGDGMRITSEDGRQALMEEFTRLVVEGVSKIFSEWVVVRPVES